MNLCFCFFSYFRSSSSSLLLLPSSSVLLLPSSSFLLPSSSSSLLSSSSSSLPSSSSSLPLSSSFLLFSCVFLPSSPIIPLFSFVPHNLNQCQTFYHCQCHYQFVFPCLLNYFEYSQFY